MASRISAVASSPPISSVPIPSELLCDCAAEAERLGALDGAARMRLVAARIEELSPDETYRWIDPASVHRELEEAMPMRTIAFTLSLLRNILIFTPLILTWYALSTASSAYDALVSHASQYPSDQGKTFLQLWQEGFHGKDTFLTFSTTGIIDVVLLVSIISLNIIIQGIDRNNVNELRRYMHTLHEATESSVQAAGVGRLKAGAGTDELLVKMQQVLNHAQQEVRTVIMAAQASVAASNAQITEMYRDTVQPMISQFSTDLSQLQKKVSEIATASTALGAGAAGLASNAAAYTSVASKIESQLATLERSQQELARQLTSVSASIGKAATSVESVASQLTKGMKEDVTLMTGNIVEAAEKLREVEQQLGSTTIALRNAAQALERIEFLGGGLIGWLLRRNHSRRGRTTR